MKIGDKVVCIDSCLRESLTRLIVEGEIANVVGRVYVISGFCLNRHYGTLGFAFVGSTVYSGMLELGWDSDRFRKLDEMRAEARERSRKASSVPSRHDKHLVSLDSPNSSSSSLTWDATGRKTKSFD